MKDRFVATFHNGRNRLFATHPDNNHQLILLGKENELPVEPEVRYLIQITFKPEGVRHYYAKAIIKVSDLFKDLHPVLLKAKWHRREGSLGPEASVNHSLLGVVLVSFYYKHKGGQLLQSFNISVRDRGPNLPNYSIEIKETEEGFQYLVSHMLNDCGLSNRQS